MTNDEWNGGASPAIRHSSFVIPNFGVIILGAGASSRMGQPKLLLPWRDSTVVGHLLAQWRELGAAQIGVVMRPNDSALNLELDRLNFPEQNRIKNPHPERGMFSSIVRAANWGGWRQEVTSWAIVLGDQPHLKTETLRALLAFASNNPDANCQPQFDGHARHPVILPRQAFDALKNSRAETLKEFLKLISYRTVQHPMDDSGLALDLDTPEDYIQARASIKNA
jgi:molybdenum cofactor cytidylyltransferase